jgi:superfamily I DNA/RNA helicase
VDNDIKFALFKLDIPTTITSASGKEYTPEYCIDSYDICTLNLQEHFHLKKNNEIEGQLKHILNLFAKKNNLTFINNYNFSSKFLRKLSILPDIELVELIHRLALRLSYSSKHARACHLLQDEFINTNGINEFRMRISNWPTSRRVHYTINSEQITFEQYYREGEHDDGL